MVSSVPASKVLSASSNHPLASSPHVTALDAARCPSCLRTTSLGGKKTLENVGYVHYNVMNVTNENHIVE